MGPKKEMPGLKLEYLISEILEILNQKGKVKSF